MRRKLVFFFSDSRYVFFTVMHGVVAVGVAHGRRGDWRRKLRGRRLLLLLRDAVVVRVVVSGLYGLQRQRAGRKCWHGSGGGGRRRVDGEDGQTSTASVSARSWYAHGHHLVRWRLQHHTATVLVNGQSLRLHLRRTQQGDRASRSSNGAAAGRYFHHIFASGMSHWTNLTVSFVLSLATKKSLEIPLSKAKPGLTQSVAYTRERCFPPGAPP